MLLIDSLYVNNSGGFHLLDYLLKNLIEREVDFTLLADARCQGRLDYCSRVEYMNANTMNRLRFYLKHRTDFTSVFCFGNIPPPVNLEVPVNTYFHNINLLTLAEAKNSKKKVVAWLKRCYFRLLKRNTDLWLVQTTNTAHELEFHLKECKDRIRILPFYDMSKRLKELKSHDHGSDYVYVANYTGAKGHEELLKAWEILHDRGVDITLHLTVNSSAETFIKQIESAEVKGVKIINHGFIPFDQVIKLYEQSKAIIYPSHNESLGLGIIEAIEAGCDVIGSDLPFIHAICKSSLTFNPYSPESIADAVMEYEKGQCPKSRLLIRNYINELIDLITT